MIAGIVFSLLLFVGTPIGIVLALTATTYIVEVTGNSDKLDAFLSAIDNRLIVEVVRSGAIGIARGDRSLRL